MPPRRFPGTPFSSGAAVRTAKSLVGAADAADGDQIDACMSSRDKGRGGEHAQR